MRAKRAKVSERSELRCVSRHIWWHTYKRIWWHTYKRIWWHTYKRIWWHTYKRIWWHTYKRIWCLGGARPDTHINAFGAWHTYKRGPWERRFGQPFKGPIIPFGSLVESHPITAKDQSRIINLQRKSYLDCSLDTLCTRGWIWNGCRHWGVGNDGRIGNSTQKRFNAIPKKMEYLFLQPQMEDPFWKRLGTENIHVDTGSPNSKRKVKEIFLENQKGSPLPPPQDSLPDAGEAINDFWSMSGKLHFPPSRWTWSQTLLAERRIILPSTKMHDVSRTTHTNLDVKQRNASMIVGISMGLETCQILGHVSHNLLNWKKKPPDAHMQSGERDWQNGKQGHLWPELSTKLGRNAELRDKQKWAIEKPKLDNAGRLRGFYFIDPENKEFKETIKNARKKLETPMAPSMPCNICKKSNNGEIRGKTTNDFKSKFACILKASEFSRMRMEACLPKYCEDHIAGKGDNSLQHYNLVQKFIPVPQAMKIPAAKAALDEEWEKLEKIPAWNLTKVRNKSELIDEARTKGMKVHFASLMDIYNLKNAELEPKQQKYKGRVGLWGEIAKDDSGFYAVFTEERSSASQMTAAKVMDTISWLPGCEGQAADAVFALYPGKNGRCSKIIENSKIGMSTHLDSSTTTQMA